MKSYGAVLVLSLFFYGCAGSPEHVVIDSESLVYEPIGTGQRGSATDTLETVVRTQEDWDRVSAGLEPAQPFEEVDFSSSMVAVVALPARSGGYSVSVQSVEKISETITVYYEVETPGSSCMTISALTLPFQAVAIRKTEGEVVFERRMRTYKCSM